MQETNIQRNWVGVNTDLADLNMHYLTDWCNLTFIFPHMAHTYGNIYISVWLPPRPETLITSSHFIYTRGVSFNFDANYNCST